MRNFYEHDTCSIKRKSALGCQHSAQYILDAIIVVGEPFKETASLVSIDTYYYEFNNKGVSFLFEKDTLVQITIFLEKTDNYQAYRENVFDMVGENCLNINQVKEFLGEPQKEGGGEQSLLLGMINPWLSYNFNFYTVNFEFSFKDTLLTKIHFGVIA